MKDTLAIFTRIQNHFGARTRKEMMQRWGEKYGTYKSWVNRGHIPQKRLMELAEREGLNIAWLEHGVGEKYFNKEGEEIYGR